MIGEVKVAMGQFPQNTQALIVPVFENTPEKDNLIQLLDKKTGGRLCKKIKREQFTGKDDQILTMEEGISFEEMVLMGLGPKKDFTPTKFTSTLATVLKRITSSRYSHASLFHFHALGTDFIQIGKNLAVSFYLSNYSFGKYKNNEDRKKIAHLEELMFFIEDGTKDCIEKVQQGIWAGKAIAEGVCLARDLVNEPASHMHPQTLADHARFIEKETKGSIEVDVLSRDEIGKLGMHAFLDFARGSEREPMFIILHYVQTPTSKKKICLIGKSVTFDSGGLSLKPSRAMTDMKMDMAGGAAVLGVFKTLGIIKILTGYDVWGILPACENMPSGKAVKPGDIVTTLSGKTIEIANTDAEGRVLLAEAISYAQKYLKADKIIDIATLTGACMVALGTDLAGLFGNDATFISNFKKAAEKSGEPIWELPLYKPYAQKLKSHVADLKNVSGTGYAGAITGALVLSEFVEKSQWIHLDIAGPAFNSDAPKGIIPRGGTGWGVHTLLEFLFMP